MNPNSANVHVMTPVLSAIEVYGDAPVYFNPDELPTLVDAIDQVIRDDHLRDDMKRRGLEQAKRYSWKKMAELTLEVYKKMI